MMFEDGAIKGTLTFHGIAEQAEVAMRPCKKRRGEVKELSRGVLKGDTGAAGAASAAPAPPAGSDGGGTLEEMLEEVLEGRLGNDEELWDCGVEPAMEESLLRRDEAKARKLLCTRESDPGRGPDAPEAVEGDSDWHELVDACLERKACGPPHKHRGWGSVHRCGCVMLGGRMACSSIRRGASLEGQGQCTCHGALGNESGDHSVQ